jgi:uncharacterized protein (DUF1697 family)
VKKYISLLRGINVSGQKKIKMEDLRALYESLDFENVRTYIQSGNVIFSCSVSDIGELSKKIEDKIHDTYGYPVSVIIRTPAEMKDALDNNPFSGNRNKEASKLYVTFLSAAPSYADVNAVYQLISQPEEAVIRGREVYLFCPGGYGKSKLTNSFFEKKLGVSATTRNWKTANILFELSNE